MVKLPFQSYGEALVYGISSSQRLETVLRGVQETASFQLEANLVQIQGGQEAISQGNGMFFTTPGRFSTHPTSMMPE